VILEIARPCWEIGCEDADGGIDAPLESWLRRAERSTRLQAGGLRGDGLGLGCLEGCSCCGFGSRRRVVWGFLMGFSAGCWFGVSGGFVGWVLVEDWSGVLTGSPIDCCDISSRLFVSRLCTGC